MKQEDDGGTGEGEQAAPGAAFQRAQAEALAHGQPRGGLRREQQMIDAVRLGEQQGTAAKLL